MAIYSSPWLDGLMSSWTHTGEKVDIPILHFDYEMKKKNMPVNVTLWETEYLNQLEKNQQ